MLLRSLKRSLWVFPLSFTLLYWTTQILIPSNLITPPNFEGYVDKTEVVIPMLFTLLCSFVLPNKTEIELSLVCGTATPKLFFVVTLPIYLYTILPAYVMLALYQYVPYNGPEAKIPIYVPENFKLYLALSLFVSVTFVFALFCFIRVLTRNCYIPLFICMFFYVFMPGVSKDIQRGIIHVKYCLVDPFISSYILGDKVPNDLAEHYSDLQMLRNAWTYNRIGFFALGVVLLVVTYLLLRREKLHKGFGD